MTPSPKRFWWLGALAILTVAGVTWRSRQGTASAPEEPLAGYIGTYATVEQEYVRFYGKLLNDPEVQQQFQQAGLLVNRRRYSDAATLLESAARRAAVPAVFNNLGVLYASLNDRARAINAFREALARDMSYQPVRFNLQRLKGFTSNAADPVTHEVEANQSNQLANLIAPGSAVEGEIAPAIGDVDCYRFTVPPPPRDTLAIEVANRSTTLTPVLRVYDADLRLLDWGKQGKEPGGSLAQYVSLEPGATIYLDISGLGSTSGAYTLTVRPMKAFDRFEPNDDIFHATRIAAGEPIEANIMDGPDTDFYSFISPRTGAITIDVRNRSMTLIPALSTFQPDMRSSGFGPTIRTPGESLHHKLPVEQG